VPLLNGRLELHQPGCDHRHCAPLECVLDVEAFCGAVLEKFNRGERVGHQPGSHAFQSWDDHDDALANLISASWQAWRNFNPVDDGRGTNRFGGYLSWILYRRHTDWLRKRYGSTRYGPVVVFTPAADPGVYVTEVWLDPELDDANALDLESAPEGMAAALELLQPWLDGEVQSAKEIGPGAESAVALVRREARAQGLEPGGEERHALAGRARGLREEGMHYKEIAAELGLSSAGAASGLVREHHGEVPKGRRREAIRTQH
jgi:DNA-directed RNA polymerase specialized sigma24 family protein